MADSRVQVALLYHFCRLRLPGLALPLPAFGRRLDRAFAGYQKRADAQGTGNANWEAFLENLHALDWFLACACLEGLRGSFETLFNARANRTEALLVDALRMRAVRLFPRDDARQEEAVADFWGYLLAGERDGSVPILARYDGQRPLVPWLIRVFQNRHLSEMRRQKGEVSLPDEDVGEGDLYLPETSDARWHEQFREAARDWFTALSEQEVLLLGLRLRYKLSQRDVAKLLGIHEGNVTRKIDALSRKCHEQIGQTLRELGWMGDDLQGFILKEMDSVLLDEPRLAVDRLAALLAARGKKPPEATDEG
jgi:RNA polymerase sigma factor (sigma-70 family)